MSTMDPSVIHRVEDRIGHGLEDFLAGVVIDAPVPVPAPLSPADVLAPGPGQPIDDYVAATLTDAPAGLTPNFIRLIDNVLVGGAHHLAWLKPDHPPFGKLTGEGQWTPTPLADAFRHYHPKGTPMPDGWRPSASYDLWVGCREIEALRMAWTGKVGLPVPSVAPPDRGTHGSIEFVEPDEAVPPTAGMNPEALPGKQLHLAGIS
jgi:hypothetical protein